MKNIFVSSLPFKLTEGELKAIFEKHGEVTSAKIITDRESGRSKGFGFVEMSDDSAADAAIEALNGSNQGGREIIVNVAKPKEY